MKISVEIRRVFNDPDNPLMATASVTLDDCFVLRNVRLVQGAERIFVGMPSSRLRTGRWVDTCHPITPEFRKELEAAVIEAYENYEEEAKNEE